jgi:hypothetical protein
MQTTPRNPYAAPTSAVADTQAEARHSVAVLIGAAIGNGIAYGVLAVCSLIFLWVLTAQGVPIQDLYSRAYQSDTYLIFAHLVGLACLMPGGYWAARLSRGRTTLNVSLAGSLVSIFALLENVTPYIAPIPLWSRVASVAIPVPAFILGALYWRRASKSPR